MPGFHVVWINCQREIGFVPSLFELLHVEKIPRSRDTAGDLLGLIAALRDLRLRTWRADVRSVRYEACRNPDVDRPGAKVTLLCVCF